MAGSCDFGPAMDGLERNELEGLGNPVNRIGSKFAFCAEVDELDGEHRLHREDWKQVGKWVLNINCFK